MAAGRAQVSHAMAEKDVRSAFTRAFECEQKQDYDGAIKALTTVPSAGDDAYRKYLALGRLCYLKKEFTNSELFYAAAINVEPKSVKARLGRLLPLLELHRYEEALTEAKQIRSIDPANAYAAKLLSTLSVPEATAAELALAPWPANVVLAPSEPASMYVATYAGLMNYRNAEDKDGAVLGGVYGSVGNGTHMVENELDYTEIGNSGKGDVRQWDVTVAYANYSLEGWRFRVGGHLIQGNDAMTQDGLMLFGGVRYNDSGRWSLGVDGFRAAYPHYDSGLDVIQFTGHFGVMLVEGEGWSVWNDLREYWINTSADVGFGKDSFFSTEDRVACRWRKTSLAAFGWVGEQVFAARNDGLTVFNLAEKHKNGVGIEAAYHFTENLTAKVVVSRESFMEYGASGTAAADLVLGMLVVGY